MHRAGVKKGAIGKVNGYPREAGQRKGNDWVLRGKRGEQTSSQGMTNPFLMGGCEQTPGINWAQGG